MIPLSLKREFVWRNFLYQYSNERVFYCSQWRWPRPVYVTVRLLLACYSVYALLHHLISNRQARLPPIAYFTVWSYILLTLHLVLAAIISVIFYRRAACATISVNLVTEMNNPVSCQSKVTPTSGLDRSNEHTQSCIRINTDSSGTLLLDYPNDLPSSEPADSAHRTNIADDPRGTSETLKMKASEEQLHELHQTYESFKSLPSESMEATTTKWYFKISWLLSNIASVAAPIVTVIFFSALYPLTKASKNSGLDIQNTNMHVLNLVFVIIDHMISARPIRLLHAPAPILFGFMYTIFSLIYWSTDRTNHVIYVVILDWNSPGAPVGLMFGLALVVIPSLQLLFFGAYQLKEHIRLKMYGLYFDEDNLE